MAKSYIPIFLDWLESTEELTAAEKGRLVDALVEYARGGSWQEYIKGNERYLVKELILKIDRFNEFVQKRAESGRKGGLSKPKQIEANESKPKLNNNINIKDNINNNISIREDVTNVTSKRRFVPPTLDEVKAYCAERNNTVDPETFIDFYTSKGWMVGKNAMKDWKAAVRGWEQRDRARPAKPSKPGRFDAINEAIRKELANGSRRNNGMFLTDGQPLVELSDAD
jgi:hypothetical protein